MEALRAVFGGGALAERVVEETLKRQPKWGSRDRRFFASNVYDLVRWWRWEAWVAGVPEERVFGGALAVEEVWRIWAAHWTGQANALPDWPETTPFFAECEAWASRRQAETAAPPAVRASVPDWLYEMGAASLGAAWPDVLARLNEPARVCLRANSSRLSPEKLAARLAVEGIATEPVPGVPGALWLRERKPLAQSPVFREGLCEVQDAGSQKIAPFLQVEPGQHVIDSCAGGGGKTLHLADLMGGIGRVTALDVHGWKLDALQRRAARARVSIIQTRVLSGADTGADLAGTADRLLIDAPCSGLGVLRRHPDTKWKQHPGEITRLAALQRGILDAHSRWLKPGGLMVYATCSFLRQENQEQIAAFLSRQPAGAWELEEETLLLPGLPALANGDHDAFYMARLRKI